MLETGLRLSTQQRTILEALCTKPFVTMDDLAEALYTNREVDEPDNSETGIRVQVHILRKRLAGTGVSVLTVANPTGPHGNAAAYALGEPDRNTAKALLERARITSKPDRSARTARITDATVSRRVGRCMITRTGQHVRGSNCPFDRKGDADA